MKKYLLLLLTLVSVSALGQIQKQVTFDFTQPSSLNPPITPPNPDVSTSSDVTSLVFKNGEIEISFARGSVPIGAQYIVLSGTDYCLEINRSTTMTFISNNGATINSIELSDDSSIGDFTLVTGQPGYQDPDRMYKYWTCDGNNNVMSVTFRGGGEATRIKKLTVTYIEPANVLAPITTNLSDVTVPSFDKLELTFSSSMNIISTSGIYIVDESENKTSLSASVSGNVITLTLDEPIQVDGTYRIVIPEGCFGNSGGYYNKALTYTVNVNTPKNILEYESVTPAPGEIEKLTNVITIAYPSFITVTDKTVVMQKEGEDNVLQDYVPVKISRMTGDSKSAVLTFDIPEGITEDGSYMITVPENTITDQLTGIYNPEFTLTYIIGTPAPVDSEKMKEAKTLLQNSGVGYPSENSAARVALQSLVNSEETPSDEELAAAIDAFYAETDVEMPVSGKYYTVAGVNADGGKLYLAYAEGALSLFSDASKATAFEATETDGVLYLQTSDGNFLHVDGVGNDSDVNGLELRKFSVQDIDPSKIFGYFSISGSIKNAVGTTISTNALINHTDDELVTDATVQELYFASDLSNAFVLAETAEPNDEFIAVDMECELTPVTLTEETGVLTLTFSGVAAISISEKSDAYLANANGGAIEGVTLVLDGTSGNKANVAIGPLPNGSYNIVLPEGTVTYVESGRNYMNKALSLSFTINKDDGDDNNDNEGGGTSGDNENFKHNYNKYTYYPSVSGYIKDVDLNTFSIADIGDEAGFYVDETRVLKLMQLDTAKEIAEGHLRRISEFPGNPEYKNAYQIVLDTPITEGSLRADVYTFILEAGTIGDDNFGKYVSGISSVVASDCNVNFRVEFSYRVNNEYATGIKEVKTENAGTAIYDLTGRRVESMDRPGIYIVNGKKVVKK